MPSTDNIFNIPLMLVIGDGFKIMLIIILCVIAIYSF